MVKFIVVFSCVVFVGPALAQCPAPDRQTVIKTVQTMFDAAATDDTDQLAKICAPGFYAFDAGKRYDAASFQEAVREVHQSGTRTAWRVTSPDVHISCSSAWISYVNNGVFTASGKETHLTWLESANLVYANNAWRIIFFESARASSPASPGKSNVAASSESTEQEITRLEREAFAAIAAKDYDKIRLLIADDYVQVEQDDERITRDKIIDRLKSGIFDYESGIPGPVSVDVLGDVVIAMYSADERFTYNGKHIALHSYNLDVWTRRNGKWVLLRTQSALAREPTKPSQK